VPLPDDIGERQRRMQLVYGFIAWSAVAFVMSSELQVPDCVIAGAVSRDGVLARCGADPLADLPASELLALSDSGEG
jgi:hypothetical protein